MPPRDTVADLNKLKEIRKEIASWKKSIDKYKRGVGLINMDVWDGRTIILYLHEKLSK